MIIQERGCPRATGTGADEARHPRTNTNSPGWGRVPAPTSSCNTPLLTQPVAREATPPPHHPRVISCSGADKTPQRSPTLLPGPAKPISHRDSGSAMMLLEEMLAPAEAVARQCCPAITAIASCVPRVCAEAGVAGKRAPASRSGTVQGEECGYRAHPASAARPPPWQHPGKLLVTSAPSPAAPGSEERLQLSSCLGLALSVVGSSAPRLVHKPCPVRGPGGGGKGTNKPRQGQAADHPL